MRCFESRLRKLLHVPNVVWRICYCLPARHLQFCCTMRKQLPPCRGYIRMVAGLEIVTAKLIRSPSFFAFSVVGRLVDNHAVTWYILTLIFGGGTIEFSLLAVHSCHSIRLSAAVLYGLLGFSQYMHGLLRLIVTNGDCVQRSGGFCWYNMRQNTVLWPDSQFISR